MRRLRHVLVLACLAIACTAVPAPASSTTSPTTASRAACSTVRYGGRTYILYKQRVKCRFARRWVKRLHRTKEGPPGWKCSSGSNYRTGGYCERRSEGGKRLFGWHPGD
jgi:hypothetical protein